MVSWAEYLNRHSWILGCFFKLCQLLVSKCIKMPQDWMSWANCWKQAVMQLFGLAIWTGWSKRWIFLDGLTFGKKSAQILAPLSMQTKATFVQHLHVWIGSLLLEWTAKIRAWRDLVHPKFLGRTPFHLITTDYLPLLYLAKLPSEQPTWMECEWTWRVRIYKALWLCWGHSCNSIAWRQWWVVWTSRPRKSEHRRRHFMEPQTCWEVQASKLTLLWRGKRPPRLHPPSLTNKGKHCHHQLMRKKANSLCMFLERLVSSILTIGDDSRIIINRFMPLLFSRGRFAHSGGEFASAQAGLRCRCTQSFEFGCDGLMWWDLNRTCYF